MDPLTLVLFVLGIGLLIKGADFLVDGSVVVARHFRIPTIVIGLTVVSFGTSLPELVVSIISSLSGNSDLLVGNILGSNIANILLIGGVAALLYKIELGHGTVWREIPFSLAAVLLLTFLANDALLRNTPSLLSFSDGVILLCFFAVFLYYVYGIVRSSRDHVAQAVPEVPSTRLSLAGAYVTAGIAMLYLGGEWTVSGAVSIARYLGVGQALIGLTIVAVGTSLPELITSVVASLKKNPEIAVGNIVGSNIFNIFFILGLAALIRPIPFPFARNADLLVVVIASLMLFFASIWGREKMSISKRGGLLFLLAYVAYLAWLVGSQLAL